MSLHRAKVALLVAAALVLSPAVAQAQLDDSTVVTIMQECRKLDDVKARMGCYDNIPIRQLSGGELGGSAPAPAPGSFGSNQLPRTAAERANEPGEIQATVVGASERQPGIYVLTLEDGAQWQFVDGVSSFYDPPRAGSTIEIVTASLGSYLLRYAGQRAIRVRRTR